MELIGDLKTYEWGKLGLNSKVALLAKQNCLDFHPQEDQSYAELWMGDHVSGPSKLKATNQNLGEFLTENKSLIGGMDKLPFLFKVLSIRKALSIQVHPNKKEAEELHAARPDLYKDPNHKPELAIALTPFLALCGFRLYEEIYQLINKYRPLSDLIGSENVEALNKDGSRGLKLCYDKLMSSKQEDIDLCVQQLEKIFSESEDNNDDIRTIFQTINRDFPNDIGSLSLFFLNILKLEPGQAIYLPANEPHAYLDGDCIECMACSDNVIRAGLTPKFKDVETLIRMLNYEAEPASKKIFKPIQSPTDKHTKLFVPAVKDFAVAEIKVPNSKKCYQITNRSYGSILIVLSGEATVSCGNLPNVNVKPGSIVFLPGNTGEFIDVTISDGAGDFIGYQAMYNDF